MRLDPAKITDMFLEDLGRTLRTPDREMSAWVDLEAGELVYGCPTREFEEDDPVEHDDDAEIETHRQTEAMLADESGRYHEVPTRSEGGRLHRFAKSIGEESVSNAVYGAMRGGGGAYRRVRDALSRMGRLQLWFDFESAEDRKEARAWLVSLGALPDDA